jgi:hypothetical protein
MMESNLKPAGRGFAATGFGMSGSRASGPQRPERRFANGGAAGAGTSASETALLHLLIPIDATERSRWGLRYALAQREAGRKVTATLLNVGEPITNLKVLRFRTHEDIARFQSERARFFLDEAAQQLAADGISCRTLFREGEVVFEILDAAEQLDCSEIVLPKPPPRMRMLLSGDVVRAVIRHQRTVPVVVVDEHGAPNGYAPARA